MSELSIKIIPREKWDEVQTLSVHNEQRHFIETSKQCLNDAKNDAYNMKWNFYGIYAHDTLIGFAMHGENRLLFYKQVWLDRFMIDKNIKAKGMAKNLWNYFLKKCTKNMAVKKYIYLYMKIITMQLGFMKNYGLRKLCLKTQKAREL